MWYPPSLAGSNVSVFYKEIPSFFSLSVTESCMRQKFIVGGSHFCQTEKSFLNRIFLVGKSIQKEIKGILSKQFTRFMDAIKA
jgi:hypothetical protein